DADFAVRHPASGLVCSFTGEERTRSLVAFEGLPRGEDVGCGTDRSGRATTLYATRYAPPITLEQALADGIAAIQRRYADARPVAPSVTATEEDFPYLVQHFLITQSGYRYITSVMVAEADGWIFKLRYTEIAVDDDAVTRAQLEASALFLATLLKQR